MSWTVACFCGNVYNTPPDCCDVCGRSTQRAAEGDVAANQQPNIVDTVTTWATARGPQPTPRGMRRHGELAGPAASSSVSAPASARAACRSATTLPPDKRSTAEGDQTHGQTHQR
jgi:hypothetical protein